MAAQYPPDKAKGVFCRRPYAEHPIFKKLISRLLFFFGGVIFQWTTAARTQTSP
jgi:hypothetical protein